jgi:hypothetical protein
MHKNATKCNETLSKWCKNKHGASKIIDTLETYHKTQQKEKVPKRKHWVISQECFSLTPLS